MKGYPIYKTSGVAWLGSIPSHWGVSALKRLFLIINGSTPESAEPSYWGSDVVWVTPADLGKLNADKLHSSERMLTVDGLANCGARLVPADSIVLSTRAPIGHVAIGTVPFCTNQGCRALVSEREANIKYWYYLLLNAKNALQVLGQGTTFMELPSSTLSDFLVCSPPLDEQHAISNYLDSETTRIDELLREKDELIGLLREARVSLISELISGSNLPGSPSGNEWIPHLPTGWELKKLKHLGQVRSGLAKGKDSEGKETVELPYLRVANVQDGHLDLTEISTIPVEVSAVERFSVMAGDVLMNEGGDYDKVGRGAVWTGEISPCLHQNHVFAVRPIDLDLSDWLAAVTQTQYAKYYFMNNAKQSTNLASISQGIVKELPVLLPPKPERDAVLRHLRSQQTALDDLITHTNDEIALLKELRAATIADAVLGRIDVRTI